MFKIIKPLPEPPYKLDWGCSNQCREGYVGIDIREGTKASILIDKDGYSEFQSNTASEIISEHSLEHNEYEDARYLLSTWNRILIEGGILKIYVPCWKKADPKHKENFIMYVCGAMRHKDDFHYSQWDYWLLKSFLIIAGFKEENIKEVVYPGPNHALPSSPLFGTLAVEALK